MKASTKRVACFQCDGRDIFTPVHTIEEMWGKHSSLWLCPVHAERLLDRELMGRAAVELRLIERLTYALVWRT
jgi:hypothetical protein